MPLRPTAVIALTLFWALFFLAAPAVGRKGVGLSGPDQVFTLTQGSQLDSYVRIYNTGDEPSSYTISISGNASTFVEAEVLEISLDPDQNAKVALGYKIPRNQAPGVYRGSLMVSILGQQISPGVSKELSIEVVQAGPNQAPTIRFLSPREGRVAGVVSVEVEASDPDGGPVGVSIQVDGRVVSSSLNYSWDTTQVANGRHLLAAEASDGLDVRRTELSVRVRNPGYSMPGMVIAGVLILFAVVLLVAAMYGRSQAGRQAGRRRR
jgi:hypothetical protein